MKFINRAHEYLNLAKSVLEYEIGSGPVSKLTHRVLTNASHGLEDAVLQDGSSTALMVYVHGLRDKNLSTAKASQYLEAASTTLGVSTPLTS